MRVGSLVFATDQGLGVLAKAFYDHGIVTDVMVVRHGRHQTHMEWYPGAGQITNLRSDGQMVEVKEWAGGMDLMLFFETPFDWPLIDYCRSSGVKTALMPMYECTFQRLQAEPDFWLLPSALDCQEFMGWQSPQPFVIQKTEMGTRVGAFTPVPVDTEAVPWRLRERAEVFVHNAGHGGLKGRNGTAELIEAWKHVKSPARLILRHQGQRYPEAMDCRIECRKGTVPYEALWEQGDVFVFPERFNGLSLPLQEARAAGMLVMATDRFPNNAYLPNKVKCPRCDGTGEYVHGNDGEGVVSWECGCDGGYLNPLIPVAGYRRNRIGPPYREFDEALIEPKAVAARIDEWYGQDIRGYSESGRLWAEENSWERLGPKYKELLEQLVSG